MGSEKPPLEGPPDSVRRNVAGDGSPPSATAQKLLTRRETLRGFVAAKPAVYENPPSHPIVVSTPGGSFKPVTTYSMKPEASKRPASDHRELKRKVEEQEQEVLFLMNVFESTSDAVIIADLTGIVKMFNHGAEELFQIDADSAIGDNLFRLCADSAPDGGRIANELVRHKRIRNLRTELVGLHGKRTPSLLTLNFVQGASGKDIAIVAVIKDNSEVEKLTRIDPLTEILNRRAFDAKIRDEHERMKRGHMPCVSILFLDVDHFGDLNKKHGHQVGDEALRKVGKTLRESVRLIDTPARFDQDAPARYGGEEFVLILPGTDEEGALVLAERLRKALAAISIRTETGTVRITASIGVRTHRRKDGSVDQFIAEANKAMLAAKNAGRNRTCAFEGIAA